MEKETEKKDGKKKSDRPRKVSAKDTAERADAPIEEAEAAEDKNNGEKRENFFFKKTPEFEEAVAAGEFDLIPRRVFWGCAAEQAAQDKLSVSDEMKDGKRVIYLTTSAIEMIISQEEKRIVPREEVFPMIKDMESNIRFYNNQNKGLNLDLEKFLQEPRTEFMRVSLSAETKDYRKAKILFKEALDRVESLAGEFIFREVDKLMEKAVAMGGRLDSVKDRVEEARKLPRYEQCKAATNIKRNLEEAILPFNAPVLAKTAPKRSEK